LKSLEKYQAARVPPPPGKYTRAMSNCIFCKIIAGEIPCRKLCEDDELLAFHDAAPQASLSALY
jgi:hypothetical protein